MLSEFGKSGNVIDYLNHLYEVIGEPIDSARAHAIAAARDGEPRYNDVYQKRYFSARLALFAMTFARYALTK